MAEEYVQTFVRLTSRKDGAWLGHPELRARLVAEADDDGSNMTEVALRILARHYHVTFVPIRQQRTTPSKEGEELNLRVPADLYRAIDLARAAGGSKSVQDEIRRVLCAHYGLRVPEKPKRTRTRRSSSTATPA